jgi:ketol-acid reductoisomerase
MIHFNFTVSNEDAESIFTILNNQISRNREEMLKLVAYGSLAYSMLEAYKRDNEYIKQLIKKMTNTKVEE